MFFALLLPLFYANVLASTGSINFLQVPVPNYATSNGFFAGILIALCNIPFAVIGLLEFQEHKDLQSRVLAAYALFLAIKHVVFQWINPLAWFNSNATGGFFTNLIACIISVIAGLAAFEDRALKLIGSISCGYVAAYELALILGTLGMGYFILFAGLFAIGLLLIGKTNDFLFNALIRAFTIPICIFTSLGLLGFHLLSSMHDKSGVGLISAISRLMLAFAVAVCFLYVFFRKHVEKKVGEATEKIKSMSAGTEETNV